MLVLGPQRTQRITGSVFRISLQPDWRSRQTKQRPFLTGQSWRVLKSGYTAGSPEQGFRHCFADGVNQSLISSARRLEKKERTERDLCQASDAFSIMHILAFPITTSWVLKGLVTCHTTYRTSLHINKCELRNFQPTVSTGHVHSTLNKTSFEI